MDDDSCDSDDAATGQGTRVAHKDLSGISIIPQETNQSPHESHQEHDKFFGAWHKHDIQIGCQIDVRRHIGEDT